MTDAQGHLRTGDLQRGGRTDGHELLTGERVGPGHAARLQQDLPLVLRERVSLVVEEAEVGAQAGAHDDDRYQRAEPVPELGRLGGGRRRIPGRRGGVGGRRGIRGSHRRHRSGDQSRHLRSRPPVAQLLVPHQVISSKSPAPRVADQVRPADRSHLLPGRSAESGVVPPRLHTSAHVYPSPTARWSSVRAQPQREHFTARTILQDSRRPGPGDERSLPGRRGARPQ